MRARFFVILRTRAYEHTNPPVNRTLGDRTAVPQRQARSIGPSYWPDRSMARGAPAAEHRTGRGSSGTVGRTLTVRRFRDTTRLACYPRSTHADRTRAASRSAIRRVVHGRTPRGAWPPRARGRSADAPLTTARDVARSPGANTAQHAVRVATQRAQPLRSRQRFLSSVARPSS